MASLLSHVYYSYHHHSSLQCPQILCDGDNSVIFFIIFTHAVKSKGVWPHLDSSSACLQPHATATHASGTPGTVPMVQGPVTTAGIPPIDPAVAKYEADLAEWEKDEALALNLLTQHTPDLTVIHTSTLKFSAVMWAENYQRVYRK